MTDGQQFAGFHPPANNPPTVNQEAAGATELTYQPGPGRYCFGFVGLVGDAIQAGEQLRRKIRPVTV